MFGLEKLFGGKEEGDKGNYDRYTLAGAFSGLIIGDKINPDNVFAVISSAGLDAEEIKSVVEASSTDGALDGHNFDIIRTKVMTAAASMESEEEAVEA